MRLRVALLTFNNPELAVNLACAIAPTHDVSLILPRAGAAEHVARLPETVQSTAFDAPRLRQPWRQLSFVRRLRGLIDDIRPDVVHMQIGHLWFNATLGISRDFALVTTVHDPVAHSGDWLTRRTPEAVRTYGYRRSDHLITHTDAMRSLLLSRTGLAADRVSVVPLPAFGNADLAPGVEQQPNQVLFFGRIWRYKGLRQLIAAEPLIRREIPDIKIVIAGRGEDMARYEQLMERPESFVVHNEYIDPQQQATLFRQATAVVLPYVDATQSGVIPAAYNFSRPVIATSVGGLPEQVDDGLTGFLVPPEDIEALAAKVVTLVSDPALAADMGRNGKAKLDAEWSAERVSELTAAVYRRAAEARGLPTG